MERPAARSRAAPWVRIEILEHPAVLPDVELVRLLPWTPSELESLGALRSPASRTSWCMSRLLLRASLSSLGDIGEADHRLSRNEFGKPSVPVARELGLCLGELFVS